jgi:transcription elongation factor GreB
MTARRSSANRASPYITASGAQRLRRELQQLWRRQRPAVVKALSAAAAEGDRSENAEYIYRKKQLREIDRRIRYLSRRVDEMKVVERLPHDQTKVRFGAWVKLTDADGRVLRYRIVGADETDAAAGHISIDSPVARALLGKTLEQQVEIELPERKVLFKVLEIRYAGSAG